MSLVVVCVACLVVVCMVGGMLIARRNPQKVDAAVAEVKAVAQKVDPPKQS